MSANLDFFRACWQQEIAATVALFRALPEGALDYRPHPASRSARELVEHLLAHAIDVELIARASRCDETMTVPFAGSADAARQYEALGAAAAATLATTDPAAWEHAPVELLVHGTPLVTLPRHAMEWFFFHDIIHHRGQLSTYVRPMGGRVPSIYGPSGDSATGA